MSKVCNKQFITLGHCEIWRHFTRTCISTRLRLVTILSLLVKYLVILHADSCNKSYIYGRCPTVHTLLIRMPMYIRAFEYFAIEIQVLRKGRLSSLNNRSSGTSTECKTLKGERRMIFIFNYNQDREIFCPCGKDALSLPVLIIK